MSDEWITAVAAAVLSVSLYGTAYIQLRRDFPERATAYMFEAVALAIGGGFIAALRGLGPVLWASAPAIMMGSCLLAGKGSISVLVHDRTEDGAMSAETARARKRLFVIFSALFAGLVAYVFATA